MKLPLLGAGLLVALLFMLPVSSVAQVWTHVLGQNETLTDYLPWAPDQLPVAQLLPAVDVAQAIREDERTGNPRNRFGLEIATDLDEQDGTWQETGTAWPIWVMKIRSAGATSLSFVLRDMYIPKNAEMYLFAPTGFMVMGPIRAEHVHGGVYASDLIYGEEVVVAVRMRSSESATFRLRVDKAIHGYAGRASRSFGSSSDCNIDVNCSPFGDGWELERDAVGLILYSGQELCSGALINSACPTLTPYFLTAFHCLDWPNNNGTLSSPELAKLQDWVVRFHYEASHDPINFDPNLFCRQAEPTSWLSYSGLSHHAGWYGSDFVLLELNQPVLGQPTLALAGWSIEFEHQAPLLPWIKGPITDIHHPRGDVKMISVDEGDITGFVLNPTTTPQYVWKVEDWEFGTVEPTSSGSPAFNSEHQIIGQLNGREYVEEECLTFTNAYIGRFDQSWEGEATVGTRLSDFLGNSPDPLTSVNSIRIPAIEVVGNKVICHDLSQSFSLVGALPGATISWSATPSEFFAESDGMGRSVTLQAANQFVNGDATLTYTVSFPNGCPPLQFHQAVWVGKPKPPGLETNPTGTPIIQLNLYETLTATVNDLFGASPSSIVWKSFGSVDFIGSPSGIHATLEAISTGPGELRVSSNNLCGPSLDSIVVVDVGQNVSEGEGQPFWLSQPNPVQDRLFLEKVGNTDEFGSTFISLHDLAGRIWVSQHLEFPNEGIFVQGLPSGVYLLKIHSEAGVDVVKILIQQ